MTSIAPQASGSKSDSTAPRAAFAPKVEKTMALRTPRWAISSMAGNSMRYSSTRLFLGALSGCQCAPSGRHRPAGCLASEYPSRRLPPLPAHLLRLLVDRDHIDELAQVLLVETGYGVDLGKDALQLGVLQLDSVHGVVQSAPDGGLLSLGLEVSPAGLLRHPEDVLGGILVPVFEEDIQFGRTIGGLGDVVFAARVCDQGLEPLTTLLEGVGDVFDEEEPEDHVLVFGGVHVAAEEIGGLPELGLEAESGAVLGLLGLLVLGGGLGAFG